MWRSIDYVLLDFIELDNHSAVENGQTNVGRYGCKGWLYKKKVGWDRDWRTFSEGRGIVKNNSETRKKKKSTETNIILFQATAKFHIVKLSTLGLLWSKHYEVALMRWYLLTVDLIDISSSLSGKRFFPAHEYYSSFTHTQRLKVKSESNIR
jgi:hypothetical protein